MDYAEPLPPQCPPNDAESVDLIGVYRLVSSDPPDQHAFKSHAALQKANPGRIPACSFASCSLVRDPISQIKRYPRMRADFSHAVLLNIPANAGRSKSKKHSNHIDFWMFSGHDITSNIEGLIDLPEVDTDGQ